MALLEGLTIGSVLGSILASRADKGIDTVVKQLHQRLREGKLPINHDLQKAVERSLRAALLVLHRELSDAERLRQSKDELEWALEAHPWLDQFEKAVSDKLATFGADLFVQERQLHEFLSRGQASDLAPDFHQSILAWVRQHITQPEAKEGEPSLFETYVTDGWKIDPKKAETITVFKAFCVEFHEVLKTDDRVFRIFEAAELKEIRELLKRDSISPQEITDALAPLVNEVRNDIRHLTNLSTDAFAKLAAHGGALRLTQREIRVVVYANHELLNANLVGIGTLLEGQDLNTQLLLDILKKLNASPGTPARIPHDRVRYLSSWISIGDAFKGRADVADDIRKQLRTSGTTPLIIGQSASDHKNVIHGTGGIGKTRLAVELAVTLHPEPFPFVLFVSAESPETLRSEIQGLADILNLPAADSPDLDAQESAVHAWFRANLGQWLLIIDNVDSIESQQAVYDLLPVCDGGNIMITSRLAQWRKGMEPTRLGLLDETAAIEVLATASDHFSLDEYQGDLATLAEKLGYLAAALEIAGAYLAAGELTPTELLDAWGEELDALIDHDDPNVDYSKTLRFAWQQSIQECSHEAAGLFEMLSLLAPGEDLEISYLEKAVDKLFPAPDSETAPAPPRIRKLIRELGRFSLIQRTNETISVIPVIAEVTRKSISDDNQLNHRQRLVQWLLTVLPESDDYHRWDEWSHLQNHLLQFLSVSEGKSYPEHFTVLLNIVAQYFDHRSAYQFAEPLMERALKIDEASFGPDHPNVAIGLNNLGLLLNATNRFSEAEPLMERALKIDEASFGPDHPNVAIRLNNLASLLQETNRLLEAEPLMERALKIDEASFGPDHPSVARGLNNLGQLLQATNRLVEAEPLMERALKIDEASFGPDHPKVAIRLSCLGQLLKATNRLLEAEPLMERALKIDEASFGPDHPNVARGLNNLGQLLQATNRLAEAKPLMKRALNIFEASFGPDHPNVAALLNNLASLLQATNHLLEAEPLMERALKIDEVSFGPDHPNLAIYLNNLARLFQDTNRLAEAEPLMERAFVILVRSLGLEHPNSQTAGGNLIGLLVERGMTQEEAIAKVQEILAGL